MHIIKHLENFILNSSIKKISLVLFTILLFKTGVWYIPNIDMSVSMTKSPFVNPFNPPSYLLWNWLVPFLGWVFGAQEKWSFFLLHLFFSIGFIGIMIKLISSRLSDKSARCSLILLVVLPVSATSFYWVGMDSATLFLMAAAFVFPRFFTWSIFIGMLLGMHHFEQAFFSSTSLFLAILIARKTKTPIDNSPSWAIGMIIGTLLGKLLLICLFKHWNILTEFDRFSLLQHKIYIYIYNYLCFIFSQCFFQY